MKEYTLADLAARIENLPSANRERAMQVYDWLLRTCNLSLLSQAKLTAHQEKLIDVLREHLKVLRNLYQGLFMLGIVLGCLLILLVGLFGAFIPTLPPIDRAFCITLLVFGGICLVPVALNWVKKGAPTRKTLNDAIDEVRQLIEYDRELKQAFEIWCSLGDADADILWKILWPPASSVSQNDREFNLH